jgi:hypothetical protein
MPGVDPPLSGRADASSRYNKDCHGRAAHRSPKGEGGRVPAIHVVRLPKSDRDHAPSIRLQAADVDARDKRGHDDRGGRKSGFRHGSALA